MTRSTIIPLALAALAACDPDASDRDATLVAGEPPVTGACDVDEPDGDPFADCVDGIEARGDASFGHDALPDIVLGPPAGGGATKGGVDVASLGCGGRITVALAGEGIVDRPGPDLLVFENAFQTGDETFAEPADVLVSEDGRTWHVLPCSLAGDGAWPPDGCAGVSPVLALAGEPFAPDAAGGDAFDLADVGLASAHWVRIVDRTREHWGHDRWCEGAAGGFDLDAVASYVAWPGGSSG